MTNLLEKLKPQQVIEPIDLPPVQKLPWLGDPIANKILRELRQRRPDGLNRKAIFGLFYRNHSAAKLNAELNRLWEEGKVRCERKVPTARGGRDGGGGRPAEMWYATPHD